MNEYEARTSVLRTLELDPSETASGTNPHYATVQAAQERRTRLAVTEDAIITALEAMPTKQRYEFARKLHDDALRARQADLHG